MTLLGACASFRKLGEDLKFMDETVVVSGRVTNAASFKNIWGFTIDWDPQAGKVVSADFAKVEGIGIYGFFVKESKHQYLGAFSDRNGDRKYQPGEPAWIHSRADGNPEPINLHLKNEGRGTHGALSTKTILPPGMITAAQAFAQGKPVESVRSGWNIPMALGEIANLDEPRFSAETGSSAFWEPASSPMKNGVGIYFLEKYDPNRIPVIFVYGAAGSPQDWKTFFQDFDRKRYQLWFYSYSSARRLEESGGALNRGIQLLQAYYGFDQLDIVAHSMGGLVSRDAVLKNHDQGNRHIKHLVTISSPFGGMKFAESGVKRAPAVIPSWRDMVPDSEFQNDIFRQRLKVPYLLIYGDKAKRSIVLPAENDGTVSVASVTRKEAIADADKVQSFHEDHVSILSNPRVIRMVEEFLAD